MHFKRTNFKVLVADDHFTARQMVANVLTGRGVTNMTLVGTGQEALDAITSAQSEGTPYHIVFLDWDMPGLSGYDVLHHFRRQPRHANTAFVMITSNSQQGDVLRAVKAGATSYIAKPVSFTKIDEKFLEVCEWVRKTESATPR